MGRRLRGFLFWLGIVSFVGFLSFFRYYLSALAEGWAESFLKPLIAEMTAAVGAGLLFFPVRRLVRRFPPFAGWRNALLHLGGILAFSAAHTTSNWISRVALYRLAGLGDYDYGVMPIRYAMELPYDVLIYLGMTAVLIFSAHLERARERDLRAAQLESSLAQAELKNLRLKLQPHFLFNALNTISATMYDDPRAADEMLDRLAELLRASLKTSETDEVPLSVELELLDAYLAVERARFDERLHVEMEIAPEARSALVPSLLLQPLVENAIRHGGVETKGRGSISVRATRLDSRLTLEVRDDGDGAPVGRDPLASGLGLAATAERLRLLYGTDQSFTAANAPEGGFRVTANFPLRTA